MSLGKQILKGGALLSGNQALGQVLRLVRNVIVARILMPEDFGVAATFWITTGFLRAISELGFKQLLIQAREGDDKRFGATIQSMMLVRALLMGVAIFALAEPVAAMFRAPEAAWAFRLLAIVPALDGLRHRDVERLQRRLRFGPAVASQLGPAIVTTLIVWPVATYVGNYSVFVWLTIIEAGLAVLISHLLAEQPFLLGWDWRTVRRAFGFGWPLLLNSLLIFAALQGDRIILARAYTKAELGMYSIALGLGMTLAAMAMSVGSPLLLPMLSGVQDDRAKFVGYCRTGSALAAVVGGLIAALFLILGPTLITIIYGGRYAGAGVVVGWLGATQALRMMRLVPVNAGVALGDTKIPLFANIFRQVGLGLALIVALTGGSLSAIAMCGLAGEACAVTVAIATLRRHGVPAGACGRPTAVFVVVMATAVATAAWDVVQGSHLLAAAAFLLVAAMLVVLSWWCLPEVRWLGGRAIVLAARWAESLKQRVARKLGSGSQTVGRKP